jgi:hypothetical protein
VAVAAVAAFGFGWLPGEMRDFEVYWTAATRALSSEPLYRVSDGHYQFKYLPAFAVLTGPAALVPLPLAKTAWFVVSVALITILIALSLALLPATRRPAWLLVAMLIVAMGKFYGHELVLGQVNLAFAVIVLLGVLMLREGRVEAAAVLMVAATVVKPYAVLMLPWLAFRGGARAVVAAGLAVTAVLLAPVVLYGVGGTVDLHRAWWMTVTASTAPNLTNADNVSLAGFFAKWLGGESAAMAATAVAGVMLISAIAILILRGTDVARRETLEAALLLTAIPLLSPQGWDYVFLVATPAVALVVNYDRELPPALRIASWGAVLTIGLSLFDVMGRQRYGVFMEWSVITICFLVVVGALAYLRMRRVA